MLNILCRGRFYGSYGVHKPICNGFCMFAETGWDNLTIVSLLLILLPLSAWYALVAQNLAAEARTAIIIIMTVLVSLDMVVLALAVFTEPAKSEGILPTVSYEQSTEGGRPRVKMYVLLDGVEYEFIEFRAKMSRFTNSCIERFDHYCPWIGNAVGRRNYRYFVLFVVCNVTLAFMLSATCASVIALKLLDGQNFVSALETSISETILFMYGLIMFISLFSLCQFHMLAIARNLTTNEILKKVYSKEHPNPHNKGCCRNFNEFLFSPITPSRILVYDDGEHTICDNDPRLSQSHSDFLAEEVSTPIGLNDQSADIEVT